MPSEPATSWAEARCAASSSATSWTLDCGAPESFKLPARFERNRRAADRNHRARIMTRYMPEVGNARAGHDVSHSDSTGETSFFFRRKGHGRQATRRLAMQPVHFARSMSPTRRIHRGNSSNGFSVRALGDLGAIPTPGAQTGQCCVRVRARDGVRALCRLCARTCRCISSKRGSVYHERRGREFSADLLDGRLPALPGRASAAFSDWANHLSTIFPEVRLKALSRDARADVGPPDRIVALSALMVGLYLRFQRAVRRARN